MSGELTPGKQGRAEPWKPGQSGNPAGRPKGARSKLGEEFLKAMLADFEAHGVAAVEEVREKRPADYLKVVASILPKEVAFDDETLQAMVKVMFVGKGPGQ